MRRKGILLAGGHGTRLDPMTRAVSKQLLPVYDRPLIYFPLATLRRAGVEDILLITRPDHRSQFRELLGDGREFGVAISYAIQEKPRGIADALLIAEEFLDGAASCLALGDNIIDGSGLDGALQRAAQREIGATVFGSPVPDPERFGVATVDASGEVTALDEKPAQPTSNLAVIGLYFYDGTATQRARELKPSARGELEITDLNRSYLADRQLRLEQLHDDVRWFDTGTPEALYQAATYVRQTVHRVTDSASA